MAVTKRTVLFLQLPQLDNDTSAFHENVRQAAGYLSSALSRSAEARDYEPVVSPVAWDTLDDRSLLAHICSVNPDVICATLYLWNVERTLHLLRLARRCLPEVRIVVGGPEVAADHPFLFDRGQPDVAVVGEGETVLPAILRGLRDGSPFDSRLVAWRHGRRYHWGTSRGPRTMLAAVLPPPEDAVYEPDSRGVGYMEAVRGCPLRCTFCAYNQRRAGVSHLPVDDVLRRVCVLRERGAREIRFVDPTFNSHPAFSELVAGLAALNRGGELTFFGEVRAETLTGGQIGNLALAGFRDLEVGVQSLDAKVLRTIRRPTDHGRLDRAIHLLGQHDITVTLDLMCGLPHQALDAVRTALEWAAAMHHVHVQFLHTLLLPGTELRAAWQPMLHAQTRPPYRVTRTAWMPAGDMARAEDMARQVTGDVMDSPTRRFVSTRLPDLFAERVPVPLDDPPPQVLPGDCCRRALVFRSRDLFARRNRLVEVIRHALRSEPHILWQFVLRPEEAEPLDLLDLLIRTVRQSPRRVLDRQTLPMFRGQRTACRVLVHLLPGRSYDRSWTAAAEDLLRAAFY